MGSPVVSLCKRSTEEIFVFRVTSFPQTLEPRVWSPQWGVTTVTSGVVTSAPPPVYLQ